MKHLSIRLCMLILFISIAGTAFTPKARVYPVKASTTAKVSQMYFWFMEPGDYIDDYADLSYQISQMEIMTDGIVNTDPAGGILLEYGYGQSTLPHYMFPQIGIYLHL